MLLLPNVWLAQRAEGKLFPLENIVERGVRAWTAANFSFWPNIIVASFLPNEWLAQWKEGNYFPLENIVQALRGGVRS